MFTAEIKVNGRLVSHIYGHNATAIPQDDDTYLYEYELCKIGQNSLSRGVVAHKRSDGIEKLVELILAKETKKDAKAKTDLHPRQA